MQAVWVTIKYSLKIFVSFQFNRLFSSYLTLLWYTKYTQTEWSGNGEISWTLIQIQQVHQILMEKLGN